MAHKATQPYLSLESYPQDYFGYGFGTQHKMVMSPSRRHTVICHFLRFTSYLKRGWVLIFIPSARREIPLLAERTFGSQLCHEATEELWCKALDVSDLQRFWPPLCSAAARLFSHSGSRSPMKFI